MSEAAAKALSVRAPWWWYILHGGKDIENRTWPTRFTGRIYLHAGRTMPRGETMDDMDQAAYLACKHSGWASRPAWTALEAARGCIVGHVDLVGCVAASRSPWFFGKFGFVLRNPVAYAVPVPCLGALGFFPVPPAVLADLGGRTFTGVGPLFDGGL